MKSVLFGILRVQPVDGEPAPEAVTPVVHVGNCPDDPLAGKRLTGNVHGAEYRAGIDYLVVVVDIVDFP